MGISADSTMNGPVDSVAESSRPVIGICANSGPAKWAIWERHATLVPQTLVDRVAAVGCAPVLLPPLAGVEHAVPKLDGLLLPGGGDLDPSLYGAAPHRMTRHVNQRRDAAELTALGAALAADVPVLGICRGLQVLNVFRGGTLHQYLPDIIGHERHSPELTVYAPQRVRLTSGSRIAEIMGGETAMVPCHHHQVIDRLGAGLTVTARSADDGTVEAAELPGHPFAVAVQWHAEESEDDSLFLALAEAARHRQAFVQN